MRTKTLLLVAAIAIITVSVSFAPIKESLTGKESKDKAEHSTPVGGFISDEFSK